MSAMPMVVGSDHTNADFTLVVEVTLLMGLV